MAESHEFNTLSEAVEVFPELPWAQDGDGNVFVDNSKTGERVAVSKGQHIVKIADRYEVHDEAPSNAHEAEAPEEDTKKAPAKTPNPQVEPNKIGAPAGEPAAPAASVDASADE